jgi:cysteine desulfurase/selenocysteine lyase
MLDIEKIRRDTPGCHDKLFLNSASSSLMTRDVTDKMTTYLLEEQMKGGYQVAQAYAESIQEFYKQTAVLLNCQAHNIAFAGNATDAYAKALSSIPFREGDTIITTEDDYISNQLAFLSLRNRFGLKVIRAKNLVDNSLDLGDFEELIVRHKPVVVAVTHVPTNSGLIQDVEAVGELCNKYDILYLVDACQSIGQLVVDVQKIKCDFITATGRKFLRGPRGTGILYVSDKVLERNLQPLIIDSCGAEWIDADHYKVHQTAKRFELWERSYMSMIGLAETVKYANLVGIEQIAAYNRQISGQLRTLLATNERIRVLDRGSRLSNIITLQSVDKSIASIEKVLSQHHVYYSVSRLNVVPVNQLATDPELAVRLSPHYFNTPQEIQHTADILASL